MKGIIRFAAWPRSATLAAAAAVLGASSLAAWGIITNLVLVGALHAPAAEHLDQSELLALVQNNQTEEAFEEAFEHGDELFETVFNALDGGGANVGNGQRFTRVPRADLNGPGQWGQHVPARTTGPNAQACTQCHNLPFEDAAGSAASNVHRDPLHSGVLKKFIERNTPHVFAPGALQRLAEEMTEDLQATRDSVINQACAAAAGTTRTANLDTKTVNFGSISARRVSRGGAVCPTIPTRRFTLNSGGIVGVDADLVVKPFQWKGSVAFLRDFNRGAAHNELGVQPVEITGDGVDGDGDGVVDEMSIGDQTALAVYLAAQPRPVTRLELNALGLDSLTPQEIAAIVNGGARFLQANCHSCHKLVLRLDDAMFSEPSQNPNYRDAIFPAGQNPVARGVDPAFPVTFDLTRDVPDNRIDIGGGQIFALGNHIPNGSGGAIIGLLGDLKRHDMGPGLAEAIDEVGTGAATFLTENLWGVGSTAPYLHDGRATTLTEAILEHGGEATAAKNAFVAMTTPNQADLIAFLNNLVLFKIPEDG